MRTITLWQPWAQLTVIGEKKFETRGWPTKVRERVAIHAAKRKIDFMDFGAFRNYFIESLKNYLKEEDGRYTNTLPLGAIVGTVEIMNCFQITEEYPSHNYAVIHDTSHGQVESFAIEGKEYNFGDYTPGRYVWQLKDPILFDKPIPTKGSQGFWNWEEGEKHE